MKRYSLIMVREEAEECASFEFDYFQWKYSDTLLNYGEGGSPGVCETREFDYLLCCIGAFLQ